MCRTKLFAWALVVALAGGVGGTLTASAGYETAEYEVVEKDGKFEIREYPDLLLASTTAEAEGRDGSFMRLFGYISGANESGQKIAMTTPVFMEAGAEDTASKMGFVVPKDVVKSGPPQPKSADVSISKREGGRFAVVQFPGRLSPELAQEKEKSLREWLSSKGLEGEDTAETAGYDPPFTPGPLRRNEVLIRLK